jgi:hypothetical protein
MIASITSASTTTINSRFNSRVVSRTGPRGGIFFFFQQKQRNFVTHSLCDDDDACVRPRIRQLKLFSVSVSLFKKCVISIEVEFTILKTEQEHDALLIK